MPRIGSAVMAGASGISLGLTVDKILQGTTGLIGSVVAFLTGTVTYSKLSGSAKVSVASNGDVTIDTALGYPETVSFVVRAENTDGDAIEKSLSITALQDTSPVLISGLLSDAVVGSAYSSSLVITGPTEITSGLTELTAHNITYDGDTGEFSSANVTA